MKNDLWMLTNKILTDICPEALVVRNTELSPSEISWLLCQHGDGSGYYFVKYLLDWGPSVWDLHSQLHNSVFSLANHTIWVFSLTRHFSLLVFLVLPETWFSSAGMYTDIQMQRTQTFCLFPTRSLIHPRPLYTDNGTLNCSWTPRGGCFSSVLGKLKFKKKNR